MYNEQVNPLTLHPVQCIWIFFRNMISRQAFCLMVMTGLIYQVVKNITVESIIAFALLPTLYHQFLTEKNA